MLSERAHYDHSLTGYLHKRAADSTKWQLRWFVLYQVSELFAVSPTMLTSARNGMCQFACVSTRVLRYLDQRSGSDPMNASGFAFAKYKIGKFPLDNYTEKKDLLSGEQETPHWLSKFMAATETTERRF